MLLIQLTGLSGAGKSTLALLVKEQLLSQNIPTVIIDGDVYRKTICADLGFSKQDRCENIRRLGAVAKDFSDKGFVAIIAAINPYEEARSELVMRYNAKTVFIDCPLYVLSERDTKGLYKKAALPDNHPDKVSNLTGVNDPYEKPVHADLTLNTSELLPDEACNRLTDFIVNLL